MLTLKAHYVVSLSCVVGLQMFFQRCARTDKGVSAIRQLVSVKISIS